MADVKKCDRCGKIYEKLPKNRTINDSYVCGIRIVARSGCSRSYDLCEGCIDALYKFMSCKNDEEVKED